MSPSCLRRPTRWFDSLSLGANRCDSYSNETNELLGPAEGIARTRTSRATRAAALLPVGRSATLARALTLPRRYDGCGLIVPGDQERAILADLDQLALAHAMRRGLVVQLHPLTDCVACRKSRCQHLRALRVHQDCL
jgi:hypothetical protein